MTTRSNLRSFLPLARGRRRDVAAAIVQRADELAPDDRDILVAIFAQGRTAQAIARTRARAQSGDVDPATLVLRAASLRRRVRRLTARLLDPAFELVRTRAHAWPPVLARVARARFIHGLTIRQTSDELKVSLHTVRSMSQAIRTMASSPPSPSRPAPMSSIQTPDREVAA